MTSADVALPGRNRARVRLTAGLAAATLLVAALVATVVTVLATRQGSDGTQAGAARVADGVTVVIVTDEGAEGSGVSGDDLLRWSLVALGIAVIPAFGIGWLASGRLLGTVDEALADVVAAERVRRDRLQEVVHELRTPLAVMGTNLELAAAEPSNPDLIDAARRAAERMGRTVDDLAGHGHLAVEAGADPTDVSSIAAEIASEHSGPAHARGLHVIVAASDRLTIADVDGSAVSTALGNLVANAVRLAPRGSVVRMDWGEETGWAWIAVSDEGPGLPPSLHARVFERGWRGRHERDRGDAGDRAGLGLTIARQLTEAQGGKVTVDSDEGGGSTFAIWLPLRPEASAEAIVASDGVHPAFVPWRETNPAS